MEALARGRSRPTCSAARSPTAPRSRRSTSGRAGSWRSRSPRWPPTGRCCCSACPARRRPGSASTSPRRSAATRPWSSRARRARPRRRCATAGTTRGCSPRARPRAALVPSPVCAPWSRARSCAIEELTRIPADVQDALITILSEKTCRSPSSTRRCRRSRDSTSSPRPTTATRASTSCRRALKRRFNTVVLPLPDTLEEEVEIVAHAGGRARPGARAARRARRARRDPRGSSRSSASCARASPRTAPHDGSSRRRRRSRPPRRSR